MIVILYSQGKLSTGPTGPTGLPGSSTNTGATGPTGPTGTNKQYITFTTQGKYIAGFYFSYAGLSDFGQLLMTTHGIVSDLYISNTDIVGKDTDQRIYLFLINFQPTEFKLIMSGNEKVAFNNSTKISVAPGDKLSLFYFEKGSPVTSDGLVTFTLTS